MSDFSSTNSLSPKDTDQEKKSHQKLNFGDSQESRKGPGKVGVSFAACQIKGGACKDQLTSGSAWLVSSCSKVFHFPTGGILRSQLPKSKVGAHTGQAMVTHKGFAIKLSLSAFCLYA